MNDDTEDNADNGLLDIEDTLDDRDPYDEGYSPPEKPRAINDWGTTARETAEGESLTGRLAREVPDLTDNGRDDLGDTEDTDGELLDNEVGNRRAGRLTAPNDEDANGELRATDVGIDGGAASAEEAAMHIVDPQEY
ncbi:DUF5709 domain-containing protein [Actinocrispum wychmicini]|uniref:DUF5709 domain-containing protein n=1 Tax=Actinocrispum wychmicini TaxID=1213861 RepID=A0A4R2IK34_9PSEU|nr:DUF5709 domain-containing protein [Actinocrispum wychmicini]TCO44178.1 hypothetical protein EV192_1251 [Actinocrispum wychmicini]